MACCQSRTGTRTGLADRADTLTLGSGRVPNRLIGRQYAGSSPDGARLGSSGQPGEAGGLCGIRTRPGEVGHAGVWRAVRCLLACVIHFRGRDSLVSRSLAILVARSSSTDATIGKPVRERRM